MSNKVAKAKIKEMKRTNKYGYWTGTYDLDPVPLPDWADMPWYKRAWSRLTYTRLYEFKTNIADPLTFHHPDGYSIRPDHHFITDMGSVPKKLQGLAPWLFSKDLWLKAYILHDAAYAHAGLWFDAAYAHAGLWFAKKDLLEYAFCKMQRDRVDDLLSTMIKASGGTFLSSGPIWFGVEIGGWASFGKGDIRHRKKAA